jgi:hypothetical protein
LIAITCLRRIRFPPRVNKAFSRRHSGPARTHLRL